jgi:hypothetical protein
VEHVAASWKPPADPAGVPRPLQAYAAYVVGARFFGAAADVSSSRDHLVDNSAIPEDGYERAEVKNPTSMMNSTRGIQSRSVARTHGSHRGRIELFFVSFWYVSDALN